MSTEAYTAGAKLLQALQSVVASPPQELDFDVRYEAVASAGGAADGYPSSGQRRGGMVAPSGSRSFSGQARQHAPRCVAYTPHTAQIVTQQKMYM